MKKQDTKKKVWAKPAVKTLSIKKDTFSGSQYGPEDAGGKKPVTPP
jgi:hypothetical protein